MADDISSSVPADPPPQRNWWIASTCVLAAVSIALATTLAIRGSSSGAIGESADGSAAAACALMQQVADDVSDGGRIDGLRLSTATSIGMLAAEQDNSYRELSDALMEPQRAGGANFDYDGPEAVAAIEDARDLCADEGF